MNIQELIDRLEELKQRYGDMLPVHTIRHEMNDTCYDDISDIHYESFGPCIVIEPE